MAMADLRAIRAPGHREFIGPKFGGGASGDDPEGLTMFQIMSDKRLADLGLEVLDQLREQFAASPDAGAFASPQATEYRRKLEFWAALLETLLEETLDELERLDAGDRAVGQLEGEPAGGE